MKTFRQFLREEFTSTPTNHSAEQSLMRLAKIAIEEHTHELVQFFETMAKKNGRLRDELETYRRDLSDGPRNQDADKDVVAPPMSDSPASPED